MHWTLWTMLISVILIIIEILVFKCYQVKEYRNSEPEDITFSIGLLILLSIGALIPIFNCILVLVFPIASMVHISENYNDMMLKSLENNKNNVMLNILYFLKKGI